MTRPPHRALARPPARARTRTLARSTLDLRWLALAAATLAAAYGLVR